MWLNKTNEEEENQKTLKLLIKETHSLDFPGGVVVKNLPANAGDTGSSPD